MKKLLGIIFLCLIGCKSVSKEEYLSNSCDCISKIEITETNLKESVADCLQSNFVAYKKGAEYAVNTYLKENSRASKEEAQNAIIENLHIELLEECEAYVALQDVLLKQ